VLVTAGPTIEDIDPVRYVSNRSSGAMGYRVAEAARDRGARVILVSGPTALPAPSGVTFVAVRSAEEMQQAVAAQVGAASVVIAAAAVSDYRPARASASKLKKTGAPMPLELVRTPDILKGLGDAKGGRLLVGFAAETEDLVANARRKLETKNLDLIVANDVTAPGAGFGGDTNAVVLLRRDGQRRDVPLASKREVAERILDEVVALRTGAGVPAPA
jgi:phosphopantothenoylcysteine decarboxylase/phosphopantothenate--cysteine ligase